MCFDLGLRMACYTRSFGYGLQIIGYTPPQQTIVTGTVGLQQTIVTEWVGYTRLLWSVVTLCVVTDYRLHSVVTVCCNTSPARCGLPVTLAGAQCALLSVGAAPGAARKD